VPRYRASPPELPTFFIDRSLGRHLIPDALREAGFVVLTMLSVYGTEEERISDEVWLERAGREGWLVLTKDAAIRRRPAEIAAVRTHGVRVVCVTTAGLTGPQQTQRIMSNVNRIVQHAAKPGPGSALSTSAS
jgi:hypothetical protein